MVPDLPYLRRRGTEHRATFFELFFDLVYVFAVTQLSHHVLNAGVTWIAAAQATLMLIAVYWAWNYTTWMTNWFDPESVPVRLVLVVVMLASLLMAIAIPAGFGSRALLFGASYAGLQVVRNAFVVVVTPRGPFHRNFIQILAWSLLSLPLWILGGLLDGARWPLWLAALTMDLAAPLVRYWLPVLGRTPHQQWQITGDHFAERFQLFVIIALGESIVLAGVTASQAELDWAVVLSLGLAFLASTALWWIYFSGAAGILVERISHSSIEEVGAIGRDVYTYLHLPIIGGIVLTAVGDELVIAHPHHELGMAGALALFGGPALYLLGVAACLVRAGHSPSHVLPLATTITTALLVAALPLAAHLPGVVAVSALVAVLVVLAAIATRTSVGGQ